MIKAIIFIISFFIITYRIGLITVKLTKRERIIEILIFGIITVFAILQIVLLPSIVFHVKFMIPYIIILSIMLVLVIASFIIVKPKQEMEKWKNHIDKLKKQSKMELVLNICIILTVVFQAISSSYLFRENADDSFYISLATQSIDSDRLYMEDPSLGLKKEYTLFSSFEQISAYELGVAVFAKTFEIKPVVLFHSILPFVFITFEYMAYYYLINIINKQRKNSKLVLLILSIVLLFGGFSSKFRAGCLLYKAWQGKGMFLNFGLTTLWALLLQRNEKKEKELIPLIIITNIANVFLSSTAIFIVSFAYIGFGIIDLVRKDWKEIGKLIISFLPIIVSVLILLILMKTTQLQTNIEFTKQNLKELILLYGSKKYLLLYLLSFLIIAFTGNKQERTFFIIIPIANINAIIFKTII